MLVMCNNCIDNASIELVKIDATLEASLHKLECANILNLFAVLHDKGGTSIGRKSNG